MTKERNKVQSKGKHKVPETDTKEMKVYRKHLTKIFNYLSQSSSMSSGKWCTNEMRNQERSGKYKKETHFGAK